MRNSISLYSNSRLNKQLTLPEPMLRNTGHKLTLPFNNSPLMLPHIFTTSHNNLPWSVKLHGRPSKTDSSTTVVNNKG